MQLFDVIQVRHSTRAYQPRDVDHDQLRAVLYAMERAPSAGNLQAFGVVVVRDAHTRLRLSDAALGQSFVAEAPVVLVFLADPARSAARYGERGRRLYARQDATIAACYAQLAAQALGLASAWVGAFDDEAVRDAIGAAGSVEPVALLLLGHPAEPPVHTSRRLLASLVRLERQEGAAWPSDGFGFDEARAIEAGPFAPAVVADRGAEPVCLGENVIVTLRSRDVAAARRFLRRFGHVERTAFNSVLVLKVKDIASFLEQMQSAFEHDPEPRHVLGRIMPLQRVFQFSTAETFEQRASTLTEQWADRLSGKTFHVRIHRRGCGQMLNGMLEEQRLDSDLMRLTAAAGTPARVSFDAPDAVIDIDTLGLWAGASLVTREDMQRYPFMSLD